MTPLEQMIAHLRKQGIKRDVDYALAFKYGKAHVITYYMWEEKIREAAEMFEVEISTVRTFVDYLDE